MSRSAPRHPRRRVDDRVPPCPASSSRCPGRSAVHRAARARCLRPGFARRGRAARCPVSAASAAHTATAEPRYAATTIEAGEYLFATARWSNDGRKSCAGCHTHRFSSDGLGFVVGTAAPTVLRPVEPMHDLIATAPYLSNGGAPAGSQAVTAIAAQARTSCELVLHGLVEGPHTAPAARVGDPTNFTSDPDDARCRPDTTRLEAATGLPGNFTAGSTFDDIAAVIAAQEQTAAAAMTVAVRAQLTRAGLFHGDPALERQELERAIGVWLQQSFLHHGLARSIEEAILPPGHAALGPEQHGRAVDGLGNFDVHGAVRALDATDLEALVLYVQSIE